MRENNENEDQQATVWTNDDSCWSKSHGDDEYDVSETLRSNKERDIV